MPTDLSDADVGGPDLRFADDLEGTEFQLREASVYEAEEVREREKSDEMPKFGRWIPVKVEDRDEWIVALGELVEELQRYENPNGTVFSVTRCEKSGERQQDPYEVNLETVAESDQTGLS